MLPCWPPGCQILAGSVCGVSSAEATGGGWHTCGPSIWKWFYAQFRWARIGGEGNQPNLIWTWNLKLKFSASMWNWRGSLAKHPWQMISGMPGGWCENCVLLDMSFCHFSVDYSANCPWRSPLTVEYRFVFLGGSTVSIPIDDPGSDECDDASSQRSMNMFSKS